MFRMGVVVVAAEAKIIIIIETFVKVNESFI